MKQNILWILSIILMGCISFNVYPEINKVQKKTFKTHPTPQPRKPQKVESWFKSVIPKKEKQIEYELVDDDKMEIAKK